MSTVVSRSWLSPVIAWLDLCDTACFQLVAGSSGSRCSPLVAPCDTAHLAGSGIQQWQAMTISLNTLVFVVTTSALLSAADDCSLIRLD